MAIPSPSRKRKESLVFVKIVFPERELRQQIKNAGGVWNPAKQAWEIRYDYALTLGLEPQHRRGGKLLHLNQTTDDWHRGALVEITDEMFGLRPGHQLALAVLNVPLRHPSTYLSTLNRLSTSLVVATCRHNGDRYGSSPPRICGSFMRNTPSAVFSVPFSYPLRYPAFSPRISYQPRPNASACSCSNASCNTRSVDKRTRVLNNFSPLWASVCPCNNARNAWAFCSLGAIFFSLRESSFWLGVNRLHNPITYPRNASRLLPTGYRNLTT